MTGEKSVVVHKGFLATKIIKSKIKIEKSKKHESKHKPILEIRITVSTKSRKQKTRNTNIKQQSSAGKTSNLNNCRTQIVVPVGAWEREPLRVVGYKTPKIYK